MSGTGGLTAEPGFRERRYTKRTLQLPGRPTKLPASIPLVLTDDVAHDPHSNTVRKIGKKRSKLCVNGVALQLLEAINKPVAVLSICGPYRTGKSYILSRLLDSSNAFALGHTMHACTFGIWIGTTVLEFDEFTLILLDTEGIDATSTSQSHDASILVLSILLSSYFIYNSQRVPTKTDLEKMR